MGPLPRGSAAAVLLALALCGCGAPRPADWAQPVPAESLLNLHRVDQGLYRSARLGRGSAGELRRLGIRTVVSLRAGDSDEAVLTGSGIELRHLPCSAATMDAGELAAFLRLACDPGRRPVLVHCWAGADRTGAMVAAYRIAAQGWSREEAAREMVGGGYRFHRAFNARLVRLIRELDVEELRRSAGIAPPVPVPARAPEPAGAGG